MDAKSWSKVKLDKMSFAFVVAERVCVDAEALQNTIRARNTAIQHGPHEHKGGFGMKVLEVPELIVCSLSLRYSTIGLGLASVN